MSLKERIAALQQREEGAPKAAAATLAPAGHGGTQATALRAKIAQFEGKGGVPVPRGSFGLGAPPEAPPKRRAELYGNRMRPSAAAVLERRDISPFAAEDEALATHIRSITPQHTGVEPKPTVVARGTAFSTALDIARKAEADVQSNAEKEKSERRRSGAWLAPQFTGGGGLVPQYTGGSFTSSTLTPQHTGGSMFTAQYTGSMPNSPPLSPYSPSWTPRSPSFSETLPKSPTLTEEPLPVRSPSPAPEEVMDEPEALDLSATNGADNEPVDEELGAQDVLDEPIPEEEPSTTPPIPSPTHEDSSAVDIEPGKEPDSPDSFHTGFDPSQYALYSANYDYLNRTTPYAARHLSTITERSVEPGSPGWDPEAGRHSMMSAQAQVLDGTPEEEPEGVPAPLTALGVTTRVLPVVQESSEPQATPRDRVPSPSPYRLSDLTERDYTPSLRSEDSIEDGEETEQRMGEVESEEPSTPMPSIQTDPMQEAGADLPSSQPHPGLLNSSPQETDSLSPSQRDSLLSLSPSQRDSLFGSSQRDSLSSLSSSSHTQTLHARPSSTIDSGSPSHVALAHRIPVLGAMGAVGVAGAEQVFVPAGRSPTSDGPTTPTPTVPPSTAEDASVHRAFSAGASSAAPLPSSTSLPATPPEQPKTPPRRHGYTTGAPRPHTTYVPPAPDPEDELYRAGPGEFGTISFGGGVKQANSFSAVVHGRVREGSVGSAGRNRSASTNSPPQKVEDKPQPMLPPMPMSPGFASTELAELLAEAAALESRLEKGELPGEALRRMSMRPTGQVPVPVPAPLMPPMPEVTAPPKPLKAQRSFRNPLARSRSDRRAAVPEPRPAPVASSSTGNLLSSSGTVPGSPEMEGQEVSLPVNLQQRSVADSPTNSVPPTPPPKSPGYTAAAAAGGGARYFSSLRRLASTSRPLGPPSSSSARGSVSTSSELSSEDSMPVATPPDEQPISPAGSSGIVWPTLTTKKSAGSIGRSAASLAGRMFSRSRTKSSASTVSSMDGHSHTSSPPPPMPQSASPSPPALRLDSTPFVIPPIETEQSPINDTPTTAIPKSPPMRPPHLVLTPSVGPSSGEQSLLPYLQPDAPESRPSSWISNMSSGTSSSAAQSPLFDKAIFDAFPSVPDMPLPNPSSYRGGELVGRLAERHQRVDPLL